MRLLRVLLWLLLDKKLMTRLWRRLFRTFAPRCCTYSVIIEKFLADLDRNELFGRGEGLDEHFVVSWAPRLR